MKAIAFIMLFLGTTTFAQDNTDQRLFEIGIDANPLFQQVLFFSDHPTADPETQSYDVIFRIHVERWAFRTGIGGAYWSETVSENDSLSSFRESKSIGFRAGIERKTDFGQRWQCFYGLDFRLSKANLINDKLSSNGDKISGLLSHDDIWGIAPLLGFRFKLNNRLSLTTETSFYFSSYNSTTERYFEDSTQNTKELRKGKNSYFIPPTSLYFTFNF